MGTLSIDAYTGTVKSDEEMYALWQKVESDIATIGQAYFAPGGVQYTFADLEKVHAMVNLYHQKCLKARGVSGRNTADIATGTTENSRTL